MLPRACLSRGARRALSADTFAYTGLLRPGRLTPTRLVPAHIPRPDYAADGQPKSSGSWLPWRRIEVKDAQAITGMRRAGRVARETLDAAIRAVAVGATTDSIDAVAHEEAVARGAYPSPLNYNGFPKSCCTSVNEVICHGIPDSYVLRDGDIVNVDVTCFVGGYHGDCSETVLVGDVDEAGRRLVRATHDAWRAAIATCRPGAPYSGIGAAVDDFVEPLGYTSCRTFIGHGIGATFHCAPNVLHYRNDEPGTMEAGHCFTIEPMICEGAQEPVTWRDGWTATTRDGGRSAQFEHTLLVTIDGVEELTGRTAESRPFFWA